MTWGTHTLSTQHRQPRHTPRRILVLCYWHSVQFITGIHNGLIKCMDDLLVFSSLVPAFLLRFILYIIEWFQPVEFMAMLWMKSLFDREWNPCVFAAILEAKYSRWIPLGYFALKTRAFFRFQKKCQLSLVLVELIGAIDCQN